jgi:hypothetical protein
MKEQADAIISLDFGGAGGAKKDLEKLEIGVRGATS